MVATTITTLRGANGVIVVPRNIWRLRPEMVLHGGPYAAHPAGMFGVCLLEQPPRRGTADLWYPIPDFSVPACASAVTDSTLRNVLLQLLEGRPVYVGCLGGKGRTGLFLALIAKVLGAEDPVDYVRVNFHAHAVETRQQEQWVDDFDVSATQNWLRGQLWRSAWRRLKARYRTRPALCSEA